MLDDYYIEQFSLLVSTKATDGYGGKTETWAAVADSGFVGKKRLLSANERVDNAANQYSEQWKIYCSTSIVVTRNNIIRGVDGDYNILSIENKWDHHLEIIISK